MTENTPLKSVLDSVLAERKSRYGDFGDQAKLAQDLKSVVWTHENWVKMTALHAEGLEMILHKIARIVNGDPNYRDSWDDIAGYAKCVADRLPKDPPVVFPPVPAPVPVVGENYPPGYDGPKYTRDNGVPVWNRRFINPGE